MQSEIDIPSPVGTSVSPVLNTNETPSLSQMLVPPKKKSRSRRSSEDFNVSRRCRVYRGTECGSDHHFIKAKIHFAQYTHIIPSTHENTDRERQCKPKRYKLDFLQDTSVAFLFKLRLSQMFTKTDESTPTKLYDGLVKSIHLAAEESLGELDNGRNKKSPYGWNDQIKESLEEKKRDNNKWLTAKDSEDRKYYTRVS
ncbi:hypothetical protein HHI36_022357 [Cryptolaemus montrouzieri]|uniref:Uncharacterized protein n=1 Tax=Cryptolaemus montrouzieri TaxID=559131 RepID=A0ABD2N0E5_9CUCU